MNILITENQLRFITENELLNEALSLDTARVFQRYVRSENSEIKINELFDRLRQSEDYVGQSKRGERLYFKLQEKPHIPQHPSQTYFDVRNDLKDIAQIDLVDYVNGVGKLPDGRSVKIPKLLDIFYKKLKKKYPQASEESHDNHKKRELNRYLNDPIRVRPKKTDLIVISRAKYDIAGMSTDRGWTSCMNLDNGGNKHYISCDLEEGSIIAYLIKKDDLNINKPIARVLIKPFVNRYDENDIVFKPEEVIYGTADESFKMTVTNLLDTNQDINSVYDLNDKLYNDSGKSTFVAKQISQKNVLKKIEYIIDNQDAMGDDLFNLASDDAKNRYLRYALYDQYLTDDQFFYATDDQKKFYIEGTHEFDGSYDFLTDEQREWFEQNRHLFN
jgi:hypothetical protein